MFKKLKKLGISILTSLIIVTGVGQLSLIKADQTLPQLDLEAKSAIAIDAKTGQIIYTKDDKQTYPVASMSKLLTAYILLTAAAAINGVVLAFVFSSFYDINFYTKSSFLVNIAYIKLLFPLLS